MTLKMSRLRPQFLVALFCIAILGRTSFADEVEMSDGWLIQTNDTGQQLLTFEMSLHPKPEPKPALKNRLIPDRYDQKPGNAAIYYLKALGFLEETVARQAVDQFERRSAEEAEQKGADDYPPHIWLSTLPKDLPVEEVKKFLQLLDFQPGFMREASRRRNFNLDRDIGNVEDPISYMLPEIQVMRQLARYQVLRTRLAIAEGRIDDAIEVLGQQYALAHHLGSDEFFVSNLVGAAIGSMAWNDTVHLLNHAQTPNLYWAFASLPKPLIDMQDASSFERQLLFEQVKCLREVTEKVRPAGYWQDFLDQFEKQMGPILLSEGNINIDGDADEVRAATASLLAAAYPGARKFLSQELGMSNEKIETYPHIQVSLLAMRRYYEHARDNQFKWDFVPFPDANAEHALPSLGTRLFEDEREYGWITKPAGMLLPALAAIRTAQQRNEQQIAMLQTVESIRHYAKNNDSKLPADLARLPLPAPRDPISGKPFEYELDAPKATLTGAPSSGRIRYRLILRIVPSRSEPPFSKQ